MNAFHPARLFVLLAREASIGMILRRGPSRWVQMIKWHTDTDRFEEGQWFHGRIYEQLSDISPNGKYVTYHAFKPGNAVKNPSYGNRWTALSNPPKFTAVTLWPFHGDEPRGGAYFESNDTLVLNHHDQDNQHYHFKHVPPKNLKVMLPKEEEGESRARIMKGLLYSLVGNQLFERRLEHDDWKSENKEGNLESRFKVSDIWPPTLKEWNKKWSHTFHQPSHTWFKNHKSSPFTISVSRTRYIPSYSLKNNPVQFVPYRYRPIPIKLQYEYILMNYDRTDLYTIENITWADFDQQGRLVLAKEGKLFSAALDNGDLQLTELADFNANKPDPQPAPDWAQKW